MMEGYRHIWHVYYTTKDKVEHHKVFDNQKLVKDFEKKVLKDRKEVLSYAISPGIHLYETKE